MAIPLLSIPDKPIVMPSQKLLPIADITDNIVIYKNGGAALVLESTSLNFGLLSEREQMAVISSYAGLLNSFNFPVQIVVRSQKKDISRYLSFLDERVVKLKNPKLTGIVEDYKSFIEEAIKKKNVLSKKFFIVILFTPYELGLGKSVASTFRMPNQLEKPLPYTKSFVIRKAKISLLPKKEHLVRQAKRLGIQLHQLTNEELVNLFHTIFNPEPPVREKNLF